MELIREIESKINKKGHKIKWAEFLCSYCLKIVEKQLDNGKRAKSCGCARYKLVSIARLGSKHSEEVRIKMSLTRRGKISWKKGLIDIDSEETKNRKSIATKGERNANFGRFREYSFGWQGGRSFEIYPQEFKQIKQLILKRDDYTCQNTNCNHSINELHVHHIDYDKQNNNPENLITLCHSCHSKTVGKNKRKYYTEFYQKIMEGLCQKN